MRLGVVAVVACACACALAASTPVLPIVTASPGTWPDPQLNKTSFGGTYYGDVRAIAVAPNAGNFSAQVWWRRRDPSPQLKAILATDASNAPLRVINATIEGSCGLVTVEAEAPGEVRIYYLPFEQTNGDAGTQFHWLGCNSTDSTEANPCVLAATHTPAYDASSVCATVDPVASGVVQRIENRDSFNAFTDMELLATQQEAAAAIDALTGFGSPFVGVFPESRDRSVRVFNVPQTSVPSPPGSAISAVIPARWTPGLGPFLGPGSWPPSFEAQPAPLPGEFYAFQLGLWAYAGAISNVSVTASNFVSSGGSASIPASAVTVVNLDGVDANGVPFANTAYSLQPNTVGSLWVGIAIPTAAVSGQVYTGTLTISANAGSDADVDASPIVVTVSLPIQGAPVPEGGAANVTSFARLAWLNSQRGLEDTVPSPFSPVQVTPAAALNGAGIAFNFSMLLKTVSIANSGLPLQVVVQETRVRAGSPRTVLHNVFANGGPAFTVYDASGSPIQANVTQPATVTGVTNSSVSWFARSALGNTGVAMDVNATLNFASYSTYAVTLTNNGASPASMSDVRLAYAAADARMVVGMGARGAAYHDVSWRWSNTTATNKLWLGRVEAGVMVSLKGPGSMWDSPMFGVDFPVVPFVPSSWGGVDAAPVGNVYGANCTNNGSFVAFSGPRTLAPGESITFLFDLQFTPSKPVNWTRHWQTRSYQVGYGTPYLTPQQVADMGVTAVTLHQGTPGIINGSLINPWINYPFLNDTVPLLANYSAQAAQLGMVSRIYYTIRELSSRTPEIFAFKAMQGELLLDQDPYIIVQPGYAHEWDTHGGTAFLHQHMVDHYAACWQQTLSNGEWDPSVCTHGTSRLFNLYVEGLHWMLSHAPFESGNYYDGFNAIPDSMLRIRRAADAALASRGLTEPAVLDLHTGEDPSPPACSYAAIYPYMTTIWNGEGFDFQNGDPEYWVLEIANRQHGMTGDMLGGAAGSLFRGLLFGMTQRNTGTSSALWKFWDSVKIQSSTPIGWWEDEQPLSVAAVPADAEPVTTAVAPVLATSYVTFGVQAVVIIASYDQSPVNVTLSINATAFGFPASTRLQAVAPEITGVQNAATFPSAAGPFALGARGGVAVVISPA